MPGRAAACPEWKWRSGTWQVRPTTYRSTRCSAASSATGSGSTATQPSRPDAKVWGQRLKDRKDSGFTRLKMNLGANVVQRTPGTVTQAARITQQFGGLYAEHPLLATEITDKGNGIMAD